MAPPILAPVDSTPPIVEPEPVASDSATNARLMRSAMLWQTIARFHPAAAAKRPEWDAAFVRALPAVRSATSRTALVASLRSALADLNDPLTRVETIDTAKTSSARRAAAYARQADGTGIVTVPAGAPASEVAAALQRLMQDAPAAIVTDLRGPLTSIAPSATSAATDALEAALLQTGFVASLLSAPLVLPSMKSRRVGEAPTHATTLSFRDPAGFMMRGDDRADSARAVNGDDGAAIGRRSGWIVAQGTSITPGTGVAGSLEASRVAIAMNASATLPPSLVALVAARRATLVAEAGGTGGDAMPANSVAVAPSVVIPIQGDVGVRVRVGEALSTDGTPLRIVADTTTNGDAIATAITVVKRSQPPRSVGASASTGGARAERAPLTGRVGDIMEEVPYPSMGARLLGAFRVWSTMRYDHVGRDAYDDDIDAELSRTIGAVEAAQNRTQYATALRAFVAHLDDSEARLDGAARETSLGDAAIPVRVRFVDGRAIVTSVEPDTKGIPIGTEITSLDGYPVALWLADRRALLPYSNDWTMYRDLADVFGRGEAGTASVRVRDATGPERSLSLPRRTESLTARRGPQRSTPVVTSIAPGIVYIDGERALPAMIDSAMVSGDLRAVIVDLRARTIAAAEHVLRALASRPQFTVARVVRRVTSLPCTAETLRDAVQQCNDERITIPIAESTASPSTFRGRIVALIDERTQGPAERFALALEAGASVTFIGTTSAGAAEETTSMPLPGRLTLAVATEEWRRSDGAPLHRVGISPLVESAVTVRGIRAGRDEPLDRAVQWLQAQLETPVRRRR